MRQGGSFDDRNDDCAVRAGCSGFMAFMTDSPPRISSAAGSTSWTAGRCNTVGDSSIDHGGCTKWEPSSSDDESLSLSSSASSVGHPEKNASARPTKKGSCWRERPSADLARACSGPSVCTGAAETQGTVLPWSCAATAGGGVLPEVTVDSTAGAGNCCSGALCNCTTGGRAALATGKTSVVLGLGCLQATTRHTS